MSSGERCRTPENAVLTDSLAQVRKHFSKNHGKTRLSGFVKWVLRVVKLRIDDGVTSESEARLALKIV
jgi:hypothetical protein